MVPDRYVLMKESPFNDNGKINRKKRNKILQILNRGKENAKWKEL